MADEKIGSVVFAPGPVAIPQPPQINVDAVTVEIAKLQLGPGDILVIKLKAVAPPEFIEMMKASILDQLRGSGHRNEIMIFGPALEPVVLEGKPTQ